MILLIDDDRDTSFLLAAHFQRAGLEVCTATNLSEAHKELNNVRAVVSDRRLHDEDGLTLFAQGRPATVRYAILVSGDDIPPAAVREALFDDCVRKPVDAHWLIDRVRAVYE